LDMGFTDSSNEILKTTRNNAIMQQICKTATS
jgi:hypothetical protein